MRAFSLKYHSKKRSEVKMNKYLDQDKRIELIDLTYDLISEVTKETKN